MYFLLYILYAAFFIRLIMRWKFFDLPHVPQGHLVLFFLIKAMAGLGLTLIYTYYYTDQSKADVYRYFNDSKIITSVIFTNPVAWLKIMTGIGANDPATFNYLRDTLHFSHPVNDIITSNSFLIRIISLLNFFSGYNIYIDTLLFNFITFVSLTLLFKTLRPYFEAFPQILYWPLFILPSFVFWSSGLLKEGLIFVGLSIYLSTALQWKGLPSFKLLLALVTGLCIVALTKIYVALLLLAGTVLLILSSLNKNAARLGLVAFFILLASTGFYYKSGLCENILTKRNEFLALANIEHSGSLLDVQPMGQDCDHPGRMVTDAFINSVLRPFLWDKEKLFQLFFGVENFIFLLALLSLVSGYYKRPEGKRLWLCAFFLFFALGNYLSIGLTVPVLGAIVHYRIIALPFMLLSVLLMTDLEKLKLRLTLLFS